MSLAGSSEFISLNYRIESKSSCIKSTNPTPEVGVTGKNLGPAPLSDSSTEVSLTLAFHGQHYLEEDPYKVCESPESLDSFPLSTGNFSSPKQTAKHYLIINSPLMFS